MAAGNVVRVRRIADGLDGLCPVDANLRRVSVPVLTFPASRSSALARWEAFQPLVPAYGAKRNLVAPGHPHVSRLSPAIRSRLVTEDEITASLLAKHPSSVAQKFLQEIFWRRYWKGWLETRPAVWRDYADRLAALEGTLHEVVRQRADEVMAGRSGVAIMWPRPHEREASPRCTTAGKRRPTAITLRRDGRLFC